MIKRRILAGLLTLIMVLQALAPGTALAKVSKPSNNNLITIGSLTKKDYPQIDKDTALRVAREQKNKRKGFLGRGGAGFFSAGSPYIPGQQPGDTDKPKYLANITGKVEAKGLDDGDFDWNKIFGDKPIKLELRQLDKTKANPQTNPLGETGLILTLEVNKAGEFKLTDRAGNLTELPLFSADGNPFEYQIQVDRKSYENVELIISTNAGTPGSKFEPVGDKQIATLFFTIGIQQLASTKFVSEWHTGVAEADRPQIEGYFKIDDETDSGFNFPKNDTIRTILRSAYEENFEEDEEKGFWSFIDSELETTPETVEVKTDTAGLTFEEKDGVKTVKSGDHKFKYDFTYDVIDGGKLTMTEILPVTFDANGGKFKNFTVPDTETNIVKEVEYDGTLTDKAENPTKDRETFKGWSTTADGKNLVTDADFKNITTAKTFYAIWSNNEITAEELTVHESFKDGDTWVNNFIPTLETLKGQVKIKDGSGTLQALANDDTFAIVDGTNEYTTDAAAKDYLYNLLKEDDATEVSRKVTLKARVTHKNKTTQDVDIPIKVIKNIYQAMTEEGKPNYVPDDYVKVTVDPTTKAEKPQKYFYYVNPAAKVVIPKKDDPKGIDNYQFTKWLIDGTDTEYKLADKPRHQFENETTIKAQYVSDVIPQDGDTKPEGVPDNFVKVTFVPTDKGTMEGAKIFWVNPEKEVTIPVKNPVGKTYFTFNEWKIGDVNTGETYTVGTPKQFTDKNGTTITATYTEAENIIPYDPSATDPMPRPKGYVRVTFAAGPGLNLTEQKAYYVKKNAGITLGNEELVKPAYKEEIGYKFKEWDKKDETVIEAADIVVTASATKLDNVIPEKDKNGNKNDKPAGYKEVTFVIKTEDKDKGSITGVDKFYVNPAEYVTINPPTTKANTGFEFGGWNKDAKIPTVYDKDTTITGTFNGLNNVIPNKNPDGTKNKKPDNYVTVTFVLEEFKGNEVGRFNDEDVTEYYVNPEKEVYLRTPTPIADTGYKFNFWSPSVVTKKYTEDTTIKGYFKKLEDIIPGDQSKPDGYVTAIFVKGQHGTLSGQTVYYVNPNAGITRGKLTEPTVEPETGYVFDKWSIDKDAPINADRSTYSIEAYYNEIPDIVPKTKDDETDKPEGYITVTFVKGEHGKELTGQAVYYVNPNKAVSLKDKAPKVTPDTGYDFAGWDTQIEKKIQYSNGDVITAQYNEKGDVIPRENPNGSDKPAGYLTVTFVKGDHGELSGKTVYYVKPNKEVTVPAPDVTPSVGYEFEKWDKELTQTFAEDTKITAQYKERDNIIPQGKPDGTDRPDGYFTVTFKSDANGSLSGKTVYYIKPNVDIDLTNTANNITKNPNVGYSAEGGTWSPEIASKTYSSDAEYTFKFKALDDVIPKTKDDESEKPKGYVTVEFLAGNNGSLEGQTVYFVNPKAGVKIGDAAAEKVIATPTPKADVDYKFDKWTKAIDKTNPITNDQTYMAQFIFNPTMVTLTYVGGEGATGTPPTKQSVQAGKTVILAEVKTLKKDNATLSGWKIGDTEYPVGASITLNENTMATAVWTTNSHTVEFYTDGGGHIPSQKVAHGSMIEPVNPPTKPGYTFTGWTLNGNAFYPTKHTITGETTLVANYVPNVVKQPNPNDDTTKPVVPDNFVKVTVDPTENATDSTKQVFWVKPNEMVQIPADQPTGKKDGEITYVFDHWNPSLIGKFSGPTTIEAQYKKQTPQTPIFDPRITTGVVATDLNKQPPLEAYRDQIKSETNKEFELVSIVEQPKVNESGFTSAKIKIRFTEIGMTQVVDVLVYVKPDPVIIEKPYPVPGDCNNSCDQPNQPNKPGESNKPNQPNQPNIGMDALNTTDHYQYLIGYPDGNFAPNRGMTRAEVATMFTRLLKDRPVKGQRYYTGFSDIQAGDWYANTVGYAVQVGIVSGYPDGSFKPNKPITRAEFASIASRFDALAQGNNIAFNDLASSHWGYNAIRSAASKGWISGYPDNTFRPEKAISRAEVTSITNRMLNRYADLYWIDGHRGEVIRFGDVKRGDWYFEPIMEATMGHDFIRDRDGKTEHWSGLNGKSFI